jgi:lysophospholipase L1-like esterase
MRKDIAMIVLLATACISGAAPIRILPLGDSITHGFYGGATIYNSYRKELKALLEAGGYDTDFVGSLTDGDFADPQHEGHDGWHADEAGTNDILGQVTGWMAATAADVILLHIGTNDILDNGANAAEVSDIIDGILGINSNATVVLALIIKARPESELNADVSTYNSNLNIMAQARITDGDDIIVVDMENGAGLDYSSADMVDPFHPSQTGYDKMATNWYPSVVMAISHQLALQAPHIDSITVTNNSILLELSNLTTGLSLQVEQADTLTPPAWTNTGNLVPIDNATNWTDQAGPGNSAFYRLVIP